MHLQAELSAPQSLSYTVVVCAGDILYQGELYDSLAKFGTALLEESDTGRQSCNCWRDMTWQGDKMEALRQAAHTKSVQAKRFQKK